MSDKRSDAVGEAGRQTSSQRLEWKKMLRSWVSDCVQCLNRKAESQNRRSCPDSQDIRPFPAKTLDPETSSCTNGIEIVPNVLSNVRNT